MIGRSILGKRSLASATKLLHPYTPRPPPSPCNPVKPLEHSRTAFSCHVSGQFVSTYFSSRCWFSSGALAENVEAGGIVDVPLAQTGEGIAECELIKWFVKEGDQVDEFQPLCEVQSDKATIEITSRYKGRVSQLEYVPGDIVKVGGTLLKMMVAESQVPKVPVQAHVEVGETKSVPSDENKGKGFGVLSTPAVRNLAREYGINIDDVRGAGKDGRVLKEDVYRYAVQKGIVTDPSVTKSTSAVEGQPLSKEENYPCVSAHVEQSHFDKTIPLRGFQRTMVKTMSMAAKVPHFYYVDEINCDALVNLKACFQASNTDPGVKHTFLPFLIKALSMALSNFPWMNSCFNEELMEVTLKGAHNIGIAMATPTGLVVPNIKNVQSLSVLEITKELSRLQQLAMDNKLNPEDITGGTITISNIGAIGGKFGSPLCNLPEVAIIAIGRVQKVPHFADDGSVYPTSIMTVNIGADHRVLDGATVARFCNDWKRLIEKPKLLMLLMR